MPDNNIWSRTTIMPLYKLGPTSRSNGFYGFYMTMILEIDSESRIPVALACGDSAQEAQRRASEIAAAMSAYHSEKRRHS